MDKALILHSWSDLVDCIKEGRHRTHDLYTTHASVEVYMKERHGLTCPVLSRFTEKEDVLRWIEELDREVEQWLGELDHHIGRQVCDLFGLRMRIFKPLYSYLGKHQVLGYRSTLAALQRIADEQKYGRIDYYERALDHFFATTAKFSDLFSLQREIDGTVFLSPPDQSQDRDLKWRKLRRVLANPRKYMQRRGRQYPYRKGRPNLLLYHSLYNLAFLEKACETDYNLIVYGPEEPALVKGYIPEALPLEEARSLITRAQSIPKTVHDLFLRDVRDDLSTNINSFIPAVAGLTAFMREQPIEMGIWGNPPTRNNKALIFELLRSEGVPVMGAQHGSVHGAQRKIWQLDSDFNRCDYFVSYGFDQQDLQELYPDSPVTSRVLSYQRVSARPVRSQREEIDVVFPITNSLSMLAEGMARTPPHELSDRQRVLLEGLNALSDRKIVVKPFMNSQFENFSADVLLQKYPHLRVDRMCGFDEFLGRHKVRHVVLEFPSTPLFEALETDAQIYLMTDEINPYGQRALAKLAKRVHIFDDPRDLITALSKNMGGTVSANQDQEFYRRYVHGEEDLQVLWDCFRASRSDAGDRSGIPADTHPICEQQTHGK